MPRRLPPVERVDKTRYRVVFEPPLEPGVAVAYFGLYPQTELHWRNGKVVAVVAPTEVYERVVEHFAEEAEEDRG